MTIQLHQNGWYIATHKKGHHIYQGYGTTYANAIADCIRDILLTQTLINQN